MNQNAEERIKITYFNLVNDPKSSVIGIFGCHEVKRDFYMSKLKLIQNKDGHLFIAFPSDKFVDPKTGQDAYSNFCWYGPRFSKIFQETALESIKTYCLRKGITHQSIAQPNAKEVPSCEYGVTVPYPSATFSGSQHE